MNPHDIAKRELAKRQLEERAKQEKQLIAVKKEKALLNQIEALTDKISAIKDHKSEVVIDASHSKLAYAELIKSLSTITAKLESISVDNSAKSGDSMHTDAILSAVESLKLLVSEMNKSCDYRMTIKRNGDGFIEAVDLNRI